MNKLKSSYDTHKIFIRYLMGVFLIFNNHRQATNCIKAFSTRFCRRQCSTRCATGNVLCRRRTTCSKSRPVTWPAVFRATQARTWRQLFAFLNKDAGGNVKSCRQCLDLPDVQFPLSIQNFRHDTLAPNLWKVGLRQRIFIHQKSQHGQR